jgi:hypothetical protein
MSPTAGIFRTIMRMNIPARLSFLLAFFCLTGVVVQAPAVSPPPDGAYPGGNTAEGQNALLSRTTGSYNAAVGYLALLSDTTGSFNTAVGAGTLLANTGDQNTATGSNLRSTCPTWKDPV